MKHRHLDAKTQLFGMGRLVTISVLILAPDGSSARQASIRSAGGLPCSVFIAGASPSRQAEAIQWTIGYLSGRITADPGAWHRDFRSTDSIGQAVKTYCRWRPRASIVEAADWFFE